MKTALVFPGQASQKVGMGKDLYQNYDIAKKMFKIAEDILGFDLAKICFEGPISELTQTKITQPALYVVSSIITHILKENSVTFDTVAGHSLGEYSALYSIDVFSFENGLKLVKERGESMQYAGEQNPGTMAAIIKLNKDKILEACEKASEFGLVKIANINSPHQIAISGEKNAVQSAMKYAKDLGAKIAVELEVSGAFHSPLMKHATEVLAKTINTVSFKKPKIPIYANVDAQSCNSIPKLKENLIKQIENPVLWLDTIKNMRNDGIERFIEVGPGKVLRGLIKRIDPESTLEGIANSEDIERITGE
ncbi:MAG: ACP S-malonyltransferase [Candidatus Marinimicrobia bacterium]|nr:ACP S-malonyltransferase [Candidatus Neomarinimicrobiota bacterium]